MLDCNGKSVEGWPVQMGDIQAQVAVSDINGDGQVELVAADTRGNVAAFSIKAKELWERHVGSLVAQVGAIGCSCTVLVLPVPDRQSCVFFDR